MPPPSIRPDDPRPEAGPTIGERLDALPLARLHLVVLLGAGLGLFIDIAEVAVGNAISAIFSAEPRRVSPGELSWLLASVFLGGAVGAPLFGMLADRYGRRLALQAALVLLSATSIAAALSRDVGTITLLRCLSGLAIGGYPPLTSTYLADLLPPRRRGMLMLLCAAIAFLGAPAIIGLVRLLTPLAPLGLEGWRWGVMLGGVTGGATAFAFAWMPESPRWLASIGRVAEAEAACRRFERSAGRAFPTGRLRIEPKPRRVGLPALLREPALARRAGILALLYVLGPWASIGFPLLGATSLVFRGFAVEQSLLFAGLTMFGPVLGNVAAAFVVDRLPRRLSLVVCASLMLAAGWLFVELRTLPPLVAAGFAFNLASAVYSATLSLYGAELFPTLTRASATASAWAVGRAVSALVPIVLLPILAAYGSLGLMSVIALALGASITALVLVAPPGRAREPLG